MSTRKSLNETPAADGYPDASSKKLSRKIKGLFKKPSRVPHNATPGVAPARTPSTENTNLSFPANEKTHNLYVQPKDDSWKYKTKEDLPPIKTPGGRYGSSGAYRMSGRGWAAADGAALGAAAGGF